MSEGSPIQGIPDCRLPPQIQVIVRDWVSANQVLLRGRSGNVLVDSGYVTRARTTLQLIADALGGEQVHTLINTHCHSDHMGGNAAVQRTYACRILVPIGEAPLIERWDTHALWIDWAGQQAERFAYDGTISPGDVLELGDLEWRAVAAPGHDDAALMFYCPAERILLSGDALWENGFGIVLPEPPGGLERAQRTLETIAALDVRVVIPGHGAPFAGDAVAIALERSFRRLDALRADPTRLARAALKAMLAFTLLERGSAPVEDLVALVADVPFYRQQNERFFRLQPVQLTELILGELEKAGAVRRAGQSVFVR